MRNKKTLITITSIVAVLLVIIGVTYAYWLVTKNQTNSNVIGAGCLDISLNGEKNDIELTEQFPLSDTDGMKLVPYEFTVTNNCNTSVDYQVNLESIGEESTSIIPEALKVALGDKIGLLGSKKTTETTLSGAYESRILGMSRLAAKGETGSSDTYELRIWIDRDAPISEQNKTFTSKISVSVGQFISNKYEEGTLAYDILSNYGGTTSAVELDATTKVHRATSVENVSFQTFLYANFGTEYTYDESKGRYKVAGTITFATFDECRTGVKKCGKYTIKNVDIAASEPHIYEITDWGEAGSSTFTGNKIQYVTEFASTPRDEEKGIYKMADDLGDSYYFRGDVPNYVQFGTYADNEVGYIADNIGNVYNVYDTFAACQADANIGYPDNGRPCKNIGYEAGDPIYWQIVRINGDNSIRLLYLGPEIFERGSASWPYLHNTSGSYGLSVSDLKYLGYTYDDGTGTQVDSVIKSEVDAWYNSTLKTKYDSIFCNDREIDTVDTYTTYKSVSRLESYQPKLTCTRPEDRYSTNSEKTIGNGFLSNPIGLMTADEVMLAGNGNTSYIYELPLPNYTMTPSTSESGAMVWSYGFDYDLSVYGYIENGGYKVRPVISLKADVEFTGHGTKDDPYVITTN